MSIELLNLLQATGAAPVSLSLAFSAGLLSTLSPCSLPFLVATLTQFRTQESGAATPSQSDALVRAGRLAMPMLLGSVLVFLSAAVLLVGSGHLLAHVLPWLTILIGLGCAAAGGWMLITGQGVPWPDFGGTAARLVRMRLPPLSVVGLAGEQRMAWGVGIGYGLLSLGCAFPLFALVLAAALTTQGIAGTLLVLAAYTAGLAVMLLTMTLLTTLLGDLLRRVLLPRLAWVQRGSALVLLVTGVALLVTRPA